jgi:hypothetical protein
VSGQLQRDTDLFAMANRVALSLPMVDPQLFAAIKPNRLPCD